MAGPHNQSAWESVTHIDVQTAEVTWEEESWAWSPSFILFPGPQRFAEYWNGAQGAPAFKYVLVASSAAFFSPCYY